MKALIENSILHTLIADLFTCKYCTL